MKIAFVVPGTGGAFYCQNCLRDHNFVRALQGAGADVTPVPLYLPLWSGGSPWEHETPIFFGAVNVYLQEKSAFFRKTPRVVDRVFDAPSLLRWAAEKSQSTSARGLEEMTLSMLRGEEGRQRKELDRLLRWLETRAKPDVVHLSNALLLGLAPAVKRRLGAKVVCTLQDEDVWLDAMEPGAAAKGWDILAALARHVDAFVSPSRTFAEAMAPRLRLDAGGILVVPPGLDFAGYEPASAPPDPPVLGFLSRLSEDQGFDVAVEAFRLLKARPGLETLRFRATGGFTGADREFVAALRRAVEADGFGDAFEIAEDYSRDGRIAFLRTLTALSVPVRTGVAFGLFMLEAVACGVPVIEPRAGAFPEVLGAIGGGRLFEPNEPAALAAAAEPWLRDGAAARAAALDARPAVLEHHGAPALARRLLAVYAA